MMAIEFRPSTHETFAERIRSADARRQEELSDPRRRMLVADAKATKRRWDLEEQQEMRRIEREHKEIWE